MKTIFALLNLDNNIAKVLIYRVWTIFAGIIVIIFVPRYLSSDMQGYYYTFLSIVALQAMFDLGLSQTVSQISSHEFAHVDLASADMANVRIGKLTYIKSITNTWYRWAGSVFVIAVATIGTIYFSVFGAGFNAVWVGPWLLLVASTGLNLLLNPRLAMVEGAGWTGAVASLRLGQSVIGHVVLVSSLLSGGQLWSVAAVPVTANLCTLVWLRWRRNPYRSLPEYVANLHDHLPWRQEILGLQWRVAVAWLGGYLASQIMVPVVFALRGPQEAGRIGLGLQIFSAAQALGMSWISARIPLFGQLISHGNWISLKQRFSRAAISATTVSALFSLSIALVLIAAQRIGSPLAPRIPSTFVIGALVVTTTLATVIYAMAAYMRAHKEEPLVRSSLVIGGLTLCGAVAGGMFSADAAIGAYAAITVVINLPWTAKIFRGYYARDNGSEIRNEA